MSITKTIVIDANVKEAQKALEQVNEQLEIQDNVILQLEKDLLKYENQLEKTSKKDANRRIDLNKKIKETRQELALEKKGLSVLNKERKKANDTLKTAEENMADYSGVLGIVDNQLGGAISGLQGLSGSLGGATKGFKLMRVAIIGTGIGALVIAVTSLATAFKSSEEGQNKFAKIMTKIGVIVGNVTDIVADFGMGIFNAGKAMAKLLKGDFAGATAAFAEMTVNITEATDGIKNFGEETAKEIKQAGELADMRAKADKVERDLQVARAKSDRDRADLLEKAIDKENFTTQQRIEFLKEAGKLEEDITNKEIAAAQMRYDAKVLENSLSKSTKEDLDEEAQLKANLIQLETQRLTRQKEVTSQIIAAKTEETAAIKAKETELATLKKNIRDAEAVEEADARALELQKIDEYYQELIDKAILAGIATDDLEAAKEAKRKEKQAEFDETDAERKQTKIDEAQAQADALQEIEDQKKAQQQATFDNAVALAGEETKLGKALLLAKQLLLAKEFILNAKAQIANAKKAVGEATVNAAEASTETTSSVAKAANTAPPPFNIPFILTAIATGASVLSAVKSAVSSTKSAAAQVGAGGGTSTAPATPITPAPSPPAFNVVGQGGASQLAEAIGGQAPTRAYVVSNDVTTAQGLERNIVEGATI
jgi:hypothetical protein